MKKASLFITAIALLAFGYAAIQTHRYGDYGGQLVYQAPSEDDLPSHGSSDALKMIGDPEESPVEEPLESAPYFVDDDDESKIIPPKDLEEPLPGRRDVLPTDAQTRQSTFSAHSGRNQWAIVYFPYNDDSTCKTLLSVRSDIAAIARKGFTTIRLHATDCNALYKVGSAAALHDMKMIIGIHLDEISVGEAESQIDDIIAWATNAGRPPKTSELASPSAHDNWPMVEMLVIGEETLFNGFLAPQTLANLIIRTRAHLRLAGFTGPVTTTEPIPTIYEHASILCPVLDIPVSNIHPYFHSDVSAENAGAYVRDALEVLEGICPGMEGKAVNLETGWPSRGWPNGVAVPGRVEQMVAIEGIMRNAGRKSVVIGWGDDGWKDEGELGVEGAWGCETLFGEVS